MKYVPPSIYETAFNCPHCSALAKQTWFFAHADAMPKDSTPSVFDKEKIREVAKELENNNQRRDFLDYFERLAEGLALFRERGEYKSVRIDVGNLWFSRCYNCDNISIWIYDKLYYPQRGEAPEANPDMPADIRRDYDEASSILDLSPRGAAALLRLSIQKLCKILGQPGENINNDIGALVAEGLSRKVQQALDTVRVIGNEAVHPGQIDLRDDRATADTLFKLLNLIVEKTISEPKHVDEIYNSLPSEKLKAIERRDKQR